MSDKTPLEKKVDELDKVVPTEVLKPEYCSKCGARTCWCGHRGLSWRSDYKGDRR